MNAEHDGQPTELIGEIFFAWDEDGVYAVSRSSEAALDLLEDASEGRIFRVRRYHIPFFPPVTEDGGELDPAI